MLYQARTDFVVTPAIADMFINIGFGVAVKRRIVIAGASVPPRDQWDEAKRAVVILIGGKTVWVDLNPAISEHQVSARVYTRAKSPLPGMEATIQGATYLDVGKYMHWLQGQQYRREVVTGHLGGAGGTETG